MSAPYKGYKGNFLTDILPTAIAFVNEGANKKSFFLFKRKDGQRMDKDHAIKLIKTGKLDNDEIDAMVSAVSEGDQAEVKKVADEMKKKSTDNQEVTKMVEVIVEKVGSKLSKDTITKLNEISGSLKGIAAKLEGMTQKDVKTEKKGDEKADPEEELSDEQVASEIEKAMEVEPKKEEDK